MDIDLTLLHNGSVNSISLDNKYKIDKDYYKDTEIIDLSDIEVIGNSTVSLLENLP